MPPKGDPNMQGKYNYSQWEKNFGQEEQKGNNFRKNPNWRPGQGNGNGNANWKKKQNKVGSGDHHSAGSETDRNFDRNYQGGASVFKRQQPQDQTNATSTAVVGSGDGNRDWSQAKASNPSDGISSTEVQALVACPACYEIPRPPIYNCQSGHITCGACREKTSRCPLCRQGYSNVRNYVVERLVENCSFKCGFHNQGCVAMIKGHEEADHIGQCNFRPLGCEIYPCHDKHIDHKEFLNHLKKSHNADASPTGHVKWRRDVVVKKMNVLMRQGYRVPFVMECFGNTFLQYAQAAGDKMWFWVSIFGTPEEAGRYRATLTISCRDKEMQTMWRGPVHSVRHSGNDIYFHGLCMVTTEDCLRAYLHQQDNHHRYTIEVAIEKAF